ncbi:MAG: glucose-6-phosphate isomerase [Planctomycetaceae bacterium]|nr:glucose-6-phosphate isomerase [Planctomycetaceae bacterium]
MTEIRYEFNSSRTLVGPADLEQLAGPLEAARDEVFADVELLQSGKPVPEEKQPLDAGFIPLPAKLLEAATGSSGGSLLEQIETTAARLRETSDRLVVLGIGGSYMGARALFEGLCHPYHNELGRAARQGVPRISFEGNNLDGGAMSGLLELLGSAGSDASRVEDRWSIAVISKSGGTLETAVAFRVFREALEAQHAGDSSAASRFIVPVTGETGRLRDLSSQLGCSDVFPIPDGVGGRFSVLTAVGLLPAAVLGIDLRELLRGAAEMTETVRTAPVGQNPALDYTGVSHLLERDHGCSIRVLSTWGSRLEAVGLWYDQLLAESLGKQEQGATPLTAVNTRDLHSRGQQHQEGRRDKLITNLFVAPPPENAEAAGGPQIPAVPDAENHDQLNQYAGMSVPELLGIALEGTNRAYAEDSPPRPTADLILPRLDARQLGGLLQLFMLSTAIEGRLMGINPYGQPGVEGYKNNMKQILSSRTSGK